MTGTSAVDVVKAFLDAENDRDWDRYRVYLEPSVEWTLLGPELRVVRGADEYLRVMQAAYQERGARFTIENLAADEAQGVVMVELLLEGKPSVDVFEVCDGLIVREREYFGY